MLAVGILAGAVALGREVLAPWRAGVPAGISASLAEVSRALSIHAGDPRLHFLQGLHRHRAVAGSDPAAARRAYGEALRRDPLNGWYLLELARLYHQTGSDGRAQGALAAALRARPHDANLLWEAALFQIQAGRVDEGVELLGTVLRGDPALRPRIYAVLNHMFPARVVVEKILPDEPEIIVEELEVLMARGDMEGARAAWSRLLGLDPRPAARLIAAYTELLMDRRDFAGAMVAWGRLGDAGKPSGDPDGNLVVNGGFEPRETFGRGFDWRRANVGGLTVEVARGNTRPESHALRVRVTGGAPLGVPAAWQVIPLSGGRPYRLSAFLRSEGGEAGIGVGLQAVERATNRVLATLGPVTGTSARRRHSIDFLVPPGSEVLQLNVLLVATTALAGRPAGTVWVDGVSLVPLRPTPPAPGD